MASAPRIQESCALPSPPPHRGDAQEAPREQVSAQEASMQASASRFLALIVAASLAILCGYEVAENFLTDKSEVDPQPCAEALVEAEAAVEAHARDV